MVTGMLEVKDEPLFHRTHSSLAPGLAAAQPVPEPCRCSMAKNLRAPALCRHWGSCVLFNHLLELVFGRTHKLLHLLATLPNLPAAQKPALV